MLKSLPKIVCVLLLSACGVGSGGGGGGSGSGLRDLPPPVVTMLDFNQLTYNPVSCTPIDNTNPDTETAYREKLLPCISQVSHPSETDNPRTRIYINEPVSDHATKVTDVVKRLLDNDDAIITAEEYEPMTVNENFDLAGNYFAQDKNTVTSLSLITGEPENILPGYATILHIEEESRKPARNVDFNNLGLLVHAAGNAGVSYTKGAEMYQSKDQDIQDLQGRFLNYLELKKTIIAVGLEDDTFRIVNEGADGTIGVSNHCEDWYKEYCIGASYNYQYTPPEGDPEMIRGTSFSAPIISVAAAVMQSEFNLTPEETFDITTACARRKPVTGVKIVGAINLECMFMPTRPLTIGLRGQRFEYTLTRIAASIPPTPGSADIQIDSTYDEFNRDFGAVNFDRPASFSGSSLPALENINDQVVAYFDDFNVIMHSLDDSPLIGVKFHSGFGIDGSVTDSFYGIRHDAYEETKALRIGYDIGGPDLGLRLHYSRQHAEGDAIFGDINGHALDGELYSSVDLEYGRIGMSLRHDVFLGGSYEFLGQPGKMGSADSTALRLGYILDF